MNNPNYPRYCPRCNCINNTGYVCNLCYRDEKQRKESPYQWERCCQEMGEQIAHELIRDVASQIGHLRVRDQDVIEIEMRFAGRRYKLSKTIFLKDRT